MKINEYNLNEYIRQREMVGEFKTNIEYRIEYIWKKFAKVIDCGYIPNLYMLYNKQEEYRTIEKTSSDNNKFNLYYSTEFNINDNWKYDESDLSTYANTIQVTLSKYDYQTNKNEINAVWLFPIKLLFLSDDELDNEIKRVKEYIEKFEQDIKLENIKKYDNEFKIYSKSLRKAEDDFNALCQKLNNIENDDNLLEIINQKTQALNEIIRYNKKINNLAKGI